MRRIITSLFLLMLAVPGFTVGCQNSPVAPSTEPGNTIVGNNSSGHACIVYSKFIFDTEALTIDVVPVRLGGLHLNVVSILNTTMGVGVQGVPSEHDPPNGVFVFDITLDHPFGAKPQLTGFDVKGILMTPGSLVIGGLYALTNEAPLFTSELYNGHYFERMSKTGISIWDMY